MLRTTWTLLMVVLAVVAASTPWVEAGHDAESMEAWQKAMTPGEPHAGLATMAGDWQYTVTFWEDPKAEPTTLQGVATKTLIMGGRFLREELLGQFMGRPFHGFGVTGYDNVTREYVSIWLDNMSTGIHYYTGQEDAKGVRTYESTMHDPKSGAPVETKSLGRVIDDDHHTFESYIKLPDGSEQLNMRVEYSRAN